MTPFPEFIRQALDRLQAERACLDDAIENLLCLARRHDARSSATDTVNGALLAAEPPTAVRVTRKATTPTRRTPKAKKTARAAKQPTPVAAPAAVDAKTEKASSLNDLVIAALLRAKVPMKASDIAHATTRPIGDVRYALRVLKGRGLVVLTGSTAAAKWSLPATAAGGGTGAPVQSPAPQATLKSAPQAARIVKAGDVEFESTFNGRESLDKFRG